MDVHLNHIACSAYSGLDIFQCVQVIIVVKLERVLTNLSRYKRFSNVVEAPSTDRLTDVVARLGENCYDVLLSMAEERNGTILSCHILNFFDTQVQTDTNLTKRSFPTDPNKWIFVNFGIKYKGDFELTASDVETIWENDETVSTLLIDENSISSTYDLIVPLLNAVISTVYIGVGYWLYHRKYGILIFKVICPTLAVQPSGIIWYTYRRSNDDRLLITPQDGVSSMILLIVLLKHTTLFIRLWLYNQNGKLIKRFPILRDIIVSHDLVLNTINLSEVSFVYFCSTRYTIPGNQVTFTNYSYGVAIQVTSR